MPEPAEGDAFSLSDFDYALPPELIAQYPLPERSASRLLDGRTLPPVDRAFRELPQLLDANDLLVFNDTRVVHARLRAAKESGGAVEILIERVLSPTEALAQLRASHAPKPGTRLRIAGRATAEVAGREDRFFVLRLLGDSAEDFAALMRSAGEVPLPPYMQRAAGAADDERYQTVYAANEGAVAAPTAGLHFDDEVLAACRARGIAMARVTLHVGAGTFLPVKSERLAEHRMHHERYRLPQSTAEAIAACRARGGRVVAVGTTTVRTLEAAARALGGVERLAAHEGETDLFITPGYRFQVVDRLITNFHLPKSTLLMLVSAFAGHAHVRALYAHAIAARYRFFSYGDAMLLARTP